jgi:hypothetical protein
VQGECRASRGELKVGRRVGLVSHLTCSSLDAQTGPLPFLAFNRLLVSPWWSHRLPTQSPRSLPRLRDSCRIWVCPLCLFYSSCPICSTTLSLLRHFLRTTAIARKKITGGELIARAKANGYRRGVHQDKDGLRDRNTYKDKAKQD